MRARGLKHRHHAPHCDGLVSRPMRARGLKLQRGLVVEFRQLVAPHAGAWIETTVVKVAYFGVLVAPHAGAWIETMNTSWKWPRNTMSRPMRARGLKHPRPD